LSLCVVTSFTQIATNPPYGHASVQTFYADGTTYRYRVRAFNASGNSSYSNIASAKTMR
jgi:hypothetical protein